MTEIDRLRELADKYKAVPPTWVSGTFSGDLPLMPPVKARPPDDILVEQIKQAQVDFYCQEEAKVMSELLRKKAQEARDNALLLEGAAKELQLNPRYVMCLKQIKNLL